MKLPLTQLLLLLRPRQYIKNGFVLLGIVFGQRFDWPTLTRVGEAFVAFSVAASAVYVFNDLRDVEMDRAHRSKRNRPIASGAVPVRMAWITAVLLAVGALVASLPVGMLAVEFIVTYLAINVVYSMGAKHIVILDVFIISSGFMLRILIGTVAVGIAPSHWLLLTGLMLTLFLGFAKRRAELLQLENDGMIDRASVRRVLDDYSPAVLDQLTGITAACTIVSYGLYTVSRDTVILHGGYGLFYTLPFVIYGMFRYLFLLHHRSKGSDAASDLMTDPHLILTAIAWLVVTLAVLG